MIILLAYPLVWLKDETFVRSYIISQILMENSQ